MTIKKSINTVITVFVRVLLFLCAFYGIYQLTCDWFNKDTAFMIALVVFLFAEYKDHEKELKPDKH
ncbi:hypothetical protein Clo1100_2420 [Clostridium sp. BNL1100]|nr:hypothetical protein Clo1100_2420 [Clostridium sp. BNL1100]